MKILFKNAYLLPEDMPKEIKEQEMVHIIVSDDKISYVGIALPEEPFDRTIDCSGNLLMPAFYNAHCHSAMTLFRGYGEDLPLRRWLDEKILPAEERLNFRRVYYGARLAIAEMIASSFLWNRRTIR